MPKSSMQLDRDLASAHSMCADHFNLTPDEYKMMLLITAKGFKWGNTKEILLFTYANQIPQKLKTDVSIILDVLTQKTGVKYYVWEEYIGVEHFAGAFDKLIEEKRNA